MEQVNVIGLENGVLKIALSGDIDLSNADAFYREVLNAYVGASSDLLFACAQLNFIDSTTLGTFVKILKRVKTDGRAMRLTNLQPKIKKLFVICALDKIITLE